MLIIQAIVVVAVVYEIQCILVLNKNGNIGLYTEAINVMLIGVAGKLWQQAPIQLPRALSPQLLDMISFLRKVFD